MEGRKGLDLRRIGGNTLLSFRLFDLSRTWRENNGLDPDIKRPTHPLTVWSASRSVINRKARDRVISGIEIPAISTWNGNPPRLRAPPPLLFHLASSTFAPPLSFLSLSPPLDTVITRRGCARSSEILRFLHFYVLLRSSFKFGNLFLSGESIGIEWIFVCREIL